MKFRLTCLSLALTLGLGLLACTTTEPTAPTTTQPVSASEPLPADFPGNTRPPLGSLRWTPKSLIFGCNSISNPHILHYPDGYMDSVFISLNQLGGTMTRPSASPMIVMKVRGERDWQEADDSIAIALANGQEPIVLICNSPGWANETGKDTHAWGFEEEHLPELEQYCRELAARYRGRVRLYQLWNEANGYGWHTHDGFNHADEYYPMLPYVYRGLKAGDPDCQLLLTSVDDADGYGDIYVRMIYELREQHHPGQRLFDAVSMHPYSRDISEKERKIRRMHALMEEFGDGDLPLYITEYGWRMAQQEWRRKPLVRETLEMYQKEDLDYLAGAIHLTLTDFEGEPGFGFTDENLRHHESYYVFQGTPRFGASPPTEIKTRPEGNNTTRLTWRTVLPATNEVFVWSARSATATYRIPSGTEHELLMTDLRPGTKYHFKIATHTNEGVKDYTGYGEVFYTPDDTVRNAGLEDGFFGGIGHGWTITGPGLCTDGGVWPEKRVYSGQRAQVVFAVPERPIGLDSRAHTWVTATPGQTYKASVMLSNASVNSDVPVRGRIGIDPRGGESNLREIVWGDWVALDNDWNPATVEARAEGDLLSLHIQIKADGKGANNSRPAGAFDDVRIARR